MLTVTDAVAAFATSLLRIVAFRNDPLTNFVARACPFQFTTQFGTKPVPCTVSVSPEAPGRALSGLKGVSRNGMGFVCAKTTEPPIAIQQSTTTGRLTIIPSKVGRCVSR